jgi:hypothetical protein
MVLVHDGVAAAAGGHQWLTGTATRITIAILPTRGSQDCYDNSMICAGMIAGFDPRPDVIRSLESPVIPAGLLDLVTSGEIGTWPGWSSRTPRDVPHT